MQKKQKTKNQKQKPRMVATHIVFFLKSTSTPVFFIYCGMNDNIKPKHENIQLILHYVLWTKYKSITLCYIYIIISLLNFKWDGRLHILCFKLQAFDCLYFFSIFISLVKSKTLEGVRALEPMELYKYCFSKPVTKTLGSREISQ